MHASTPAPDTGTDSQNDPTGRHGDVDRNGDLVDELDDRLRGAITAATPDLVDEQLVGVRRMVQLSRAWTVRT